MEVIPLSPPDQPGLRAVLLEALAAVRRKVEAYRKPDPALLTALTTLLDQLKVIDSAPVGSQLLGLEEKLKTMELRLGNLEAMTRTRSAQPRLG